MTSAAPAPAPAALWFDGAVGAAIAAARAQGSLLIVFVKDSSEDSESIEAALQDAHTKNTLTKQMVALRLQSESVEAQQFAQIYPFTTTPVVFVIDSAGGTVLDKLEGAAGAHVVDHLTVATPMGASAAAKVAAVRERIAARRKELAEQRAQKAREDEVARRAQGKALLSAQRQREEEQARKLAEEMAAERRQAQAQRDAVRARIQQDQAERRAKAAAKSSTGDSAAPLSTPTSPTSSAPATTTTTAAATTTTTAAAAAAAAAADALSDVARVACRLPDGSTLKLELSATTTVAELRQRVVQHQPSLGHSVGLRANYPLRVLTSADDSSSLRDLQLLRAQIIVTPAQDALPTSSSQLATVLSYLNPLSLFTFLLSLPPLSWLFGRGSASSSSSSSSPSPSSSSSSSSNAPAPARQPAPSLSSAAGSAAAARAASARVVRVSDLNSLNDEDKKKHSYNGNSVQYEH